MTVPLQAAPGAGLSRVLAKHAAAADVAAMPQAAVTATKASILDQIGVILAASGLSDECRPFIRMAREEGGGGSTVLGCGFRASMGMAAFANGAMAHALDYEDTHDETLVHPMAAVLPAALAVAEAIGASGRDLLAAVAVGADISCRIGQAFEGNPERRDGFLLLPFVGAYGATAAVGRLLRSDADRIEQALSLVFFQIAGSAAVQRYGASHIRGVRDAFNARAAVTAAMLAHDGVNGFDRPLEGEAGYFALYAGGRFSSDKALASLGERYEIERVSYKPWPACRGTHAFIEAALSIASRHAIDASRIEGIHATVSPFFRVLCEPRDVRTGPANSVTAKFSIPFTVAVALARRGVSFDHFTEAGLRDPEVLRLARLVSHEVAPQWGQAESTRGALELRLTSGECFREEVIYPRGHPRNPMSSAELRQKFLACASHAQVHLADTAAEQLAERIERLERLQRATDLLPS